MAAAKRARHDFTLADKVWLLDYSERNPGINATDLGVALAQHINSTRSQDQVSIPAPKKSTVNDWRKAAHKLREQWQKANPGNNKSKRQRVPKHAQLEQALALWFGQQEARDLAMTDEMLREQARQFAPHFDVPNDFRYSNGWLANFKRRQGIKQVVLHGEANDADDTGVELARKAIPKIVEEVVYPADNISNQDDTGQFWRQGPQRSLATGKQAGRKKDKQHITVSLSCNATGTDKRELFVIGKAKRPRSFPKTFQPQRDWGVRYRNNKKAWMMSADLGE
jgi:hypothetical protein